jgi:hypothetical protein
MYCEVSICANENDGNKKMINTKKYLCKVWFIAGTFDILQYLIKNPANMLLVKPKMSFYQKKKFDLKIQGKNSTSFERNVITL